MMSFSAQPTNSSSKSTNLAKLTRELLRNRDLILASNRGPIKHQIAGGELKATRGSGGVVTVLTTLNEYVPFTWVASALNEGDQRAVQSSKGRPIPTSLGSHELLLRYVESPESVYNRYYNIFANPFLWFLQHTMLDLPYSPIVDQNLYNAWETGYLPVNKAFAKAIIEQAKTSTSPPVVILHDYHLYMVGGSVREALPNALLQHFVHIPWPDPSHWNVLPENMRRDILASLCSCDIVGLQTARDAHNFLLTCQEFLPGVDLDPTARVIRFAGRTIAARNYPVSVDIPQLEQTAHSSEVKAYEDSLRKLTTAKTIVRVDRLEPSKNILRGFHAYETLLIRHPELLGQVTFLAFLIPSRTGIRAYQLHATEVQNIITRINATFGRSNWMPIHLFHEDNYPQAIAGMRLYDVLLVNPIADGMNLVAKEGPTINTRDGVLVLSEKAGAHEQLAPGAISISPTDVEGTATALYKALNLGTSQRTKQSKRLREIIQSSDLTDWLYHQIADFTTLVK
jgi:trehalose 6-phosphate synthase